MKAWFDRRMVHKILFVVGNLVVVLAAIVLIGLPTHEFFAERDEQIVRQRAVLAKLSSVARRADDVAQAAQELDRQQDGFLTGPNDGVINADLQTRLKRLAENAGNRVRSVQGLPAVLLDRAQYSASRLEISGPIQSIHRAIHAIESAKPFFFITSASLKISPNAGAHVKHPEEPILSAQLDIIAAVKTSDRAP